jgi:ribosomal protein S18 acetylase RimI-like enzyme
VIEGLIVEALGPDHNRTGFACGAEALDRYLRERALQDVRRRLSNCFAALSPVGVIAGYYTLAATGILLTELPPEVTRRLPRYPTVPAALIGRLAVDLQFRGQGLGAALIVDALARVMRAEPAIFALVVDAKDDAALRFYQHLGFQRFARHPMRLYLPVAEAARRLAEKTR